MVPSISCTSIRIFPFFSSDSPGTCCNGCYFGVLGTLSGIGFQGFEKTFWVFIGLNNMFFLFQIIICYFWCHESSYADHHQKPVLNKGVTFFANCWYVLTWLLYSAPLSLCVNWLLLCTSSARTTAEIFISDPQVSCIFPRKGKPNLKFEMPKVKFEMDTTLLAMHKWLCWALRFFCLHFRVIIWTSYLCIHFFDL